MASWGEEHERLCDTDQDTGTGAWELGTCLDERASAQAITPRAPTVPAVPEKHSAPETGHTESGGKKLESKLPKYTQPCHLAHKEIQSQLPWGLRYNKGQSEDLVTHWEGQPANKQGVQPKIREPVLGTTIMWTIINPQAHAVLQ